MSRRNRWTKRPWRDARHSREFASGKSAQLPLAKQSPPLTKWRRRLTNLRSGSRSDLRGARKLLPTYVSYNAPQVTRLSNKRRSLSAARDPASKFHCQLLLEFHSREGSPPWSETVLSEWIQFVYSTNSRHSVAWKSVCLSANGRHFDIEIRGEKNPRRDPNTSIALNSSPGELWILVLLSVKWKFPLYLATGSKRPRVFVRSHQSRCSLLESDRCWVFFFWLDFGSGSCLFFWFWVVTVCIYCS